MKLIGAIALALVLLVPSVGAGFTPSHDVREYTVKVFQVFQPDGNGEISGSFLFEKPHDFEVLERNSTFIIDVAYTLEGGVGQRIRQYTFETNFGQSCSWETRIGSNLQALNDNKQIVCFNGVVVESDTNFWINITASSGGNPIQSVNYGIILTQRDTVNMSTTFESLTGLTALEFAVFLLIAFIGIILWSRSQDMAVQAFGSIITVMGGVLLTAFAAEAGIEIVWRGTVPFGIAMGLLGAYLFIATFMDFGSDAA